MDAASHTRSGAAARSVSRTARKPRGAPPSPASGGGKRRMFSAVFSSLFMGEVSSGTQRRKTEGAPFLFHAFLTGSALVFFGCGGGGITARSSPSCQARRSSKANRHSPLAARDFPALKSLQRRP